MEKQKSAVPDKNMFARVTESQLDWYECGHSRLSVYGFAFYEGDKTFCRLPSALMTEITAENQSLSLLARHTSGGMLSFSTDSPCIALRAELESRPVLSHMAASAECGADCYIRSGAQEFIFAGAVKYDTAQTEWEYVFGSDFGSEPKDVIVYFPLYAAVKSLKVGISRDANVLPVKSPFRLSGSIVVYGTSITQGACASRPAMSYVSQLDRKLGIECFNMGFSGNAFCEKSVAAALSLIPNVRLFIIDCEANAGPAGKLDTALGEFISVLRQKQPFVPILILSGIRVSDNLNPVRKNSFQSYKKIQRTLVECLRRAGDSHIHFFDGETLLGEDWHECTVDGVHPTDLGFYRMANGLCKTVENLLNIT